MGKIGVIASIPLPEGGASFEAGLAQAKLTRMPGTGKMFLPYKERTNEYRTGLDPNASYIKRISDPQARKIEIERVTKEKFRLEEAMGIFSLNDDPRTGLGPRAEFYNIALWSPTASKSKLYVEPIKLMDGNNYFDLDDPMQAITFAWLRVHPGIAMSWEAYQRGEFPDAKFYVHDDEVEQEITYRKKTALNKATRELDKLSIEKRKKIARQLGLPVTDDDRESVVYNQIDSFLKQGVVKLGAYEGSEAVEVFDRYLTMQDDVLHVKDLVKQALTHSVYRIDKLGKLFEGQVEVAKSESDLVDHLLDEKNQTDIIILEDKIKAKKSIMI